MWLNFSLSLVRSILLYLLKPVQRQPLDVSEALCLESCGPACRYDGTETGDKIRPAEPQCIRSSVTQALRLLSQLGSS